jgi:hypothetical protein
VIACTADQPDAAEHVATSGALTLDEVIDCLTAIRDITFPRGVAPLLARLTMLAGELVAGLPGRDQAMSAPPAPNGSLPQGMTQRA